MNPAGDVKKEYCMVGFCISENQVDGYCYPICGQKVGYLDRFIIWYRTIKNRDATRRKLNDTISYDGFELGCKGRCRTRAGQTCDQLGNVMELTPP